MDSARLTAVEALNSAKSVFSNLRLPTWQRFTPQQQDEQQDDEDEQVVYYKRVAATDDDQSKATDSNEDAIRNEEQQAADPPCTDATTEPAPPTDPHPKQQQSASPSTGVTDLLGVESEMLHMRITQGGIDSSSSAHNSRVWHESLRLLGLTPEDLQGDEPPTPASVAAHHKATNTTGSTSSQPSSSQQQQVSSEDVDVQASIAAALQTPISGSPRAEPGSSDQTQAASGDLSRTSSPGGEPPKKELMIYALPLYRDRLVFLPVSSWKEAPQQQPKQGIQGQIAKRVEGATQQVADTWQHLKSSAPGSIKNNIYKFGQRILEDISPEERLMRNIPKEVDKIIINHPTSVGPDEIMDILSGMTKGYGLAAAGKAAAAGLMLPIAMGIDLIVLPGPQVLTYYTLWELYRNTNGTIGNQRLTKMVQQKDEKSVRINFVPEERLNKYAILSHDAPEEVLREEEIELLCWELGEPDLLQPLLELRRRELRKNSKGGRNGVSYSKVRGTDC